MAGSGVLASYGDKDVAMRNMVLVMLTELGFPGVRVAEVFGLTPEHLSTLRGNVRRHGLASLVQRRGRPSRVSAEQARQARAW
jgi:transposase